MSGKVPDESAVNNGIQQFGGHMHVGNQAVGANARIDAGDVSVQAVGSPQAAELLVRIEQLLSQHAADLPDQDGTLRELRRIREELAEPEPQHGIIQRALERLTAFVKPVAPLVVAVGQLAQAVESAHGH